MCDFYGLERYGGAAALLPGELRSRAMELCPAERAQAEELRLRAGRKLSVVLPEGERELGGDALTRRELDAVLEVATGASAHTARDGVCSGYVTAAGGYRIGLCGTVAMRNGAVAGFRFLSSVAVRVSRQIIGAADGI
ncbi:MAG: stage III sporulation protein AB, partial [Oscillospiraceae bacterium]|nr:stage III sporulation protein AB [Oscillospiraceae bacterium]